MKNNEKLFAAIAENNISAVGKLIKPSFFGLRKGADVNGSQASGWTPLMFASNTGSKEIVELLVAKGADLDVRNEFGDTLFILAAAYGRHRDVAELLLAKGADINAKNKDGNTALLQVLQPTFDKLTQDAIDIAKWLIGKGADVNAKNNDGQTPLMLAQKAGCQEIVELLMAKGGMRHETADKGKTPIASSAKTDYTEKQMGKYWAYLHKHGKIQVKEWYPGNTFLSEASASPYVKRFLKEPFAARSIEDAEEIAKKLLNE